MSVVAVILAAGASRRLGRPKQLLELAGQTLLEGAIRMAQDAGASPVLTVLGADFATICTSISFNGATPVLNDKWEQGISTSIHAGLRETDVRAPYATGALLMACDQPRLSAEHLRGLLETFRAQSEPAIVASFYAGTCGIPSVFPRSVFADLRALCGDQGARTLLKEPPCGVIPMTFEGGEVDIDWPSDLANLE